MRTSEMVDNLSKQVEEVEALCSIYGSEWQTEDEANRSYSIRVEEGGTIATLYIKFPLDYPLESPPQYQLSAPHLSAERKQYICMQLEELYLEHLGEPVIYQWVEKIREQLQQMHHGTSEVNVADESEIDPLSSESFSVPCKDSSAAGPRITHGTTITDRKSVFQGHAAIVTSPEQVRQVLEELYQNKKIANATHNMYAYRIQKQDIKSSIHDCDDDGETQAGSRLLHLLKILDVQNVLVVVTRWYGGVHLGSDRFRHINNAARQTLDAAGLLKKTNHQEKKKHK